MGARAYRPAPDSTPGFDRFAARLTDLLSHRLPFDENGLLAPHAVPLSPRARTEWVNLYDTVERALASGGDLRAVADWSAKAAEHAARVAALYELIEQGGVPAAISEGAMSKAAALVLWYARESMRIFGDDDGPAADAEILEAFLVSSGGMLPKRSIQNGGPGPLRDGRRLSAAVALLEELGRVRVRRDGRSEIVELHPALWGPQP
jgi:putative DNA primase/helicase